MIPAKPEEATISAAIRSPDSGPPSSDDPALLRALQEYRVAREAGQKPDRPAFLARHPTVRPELAACLDALDFVYDAAPQVQQSVADSSAAATAESLPSSAPLGDYRLIREVGRGGMGIVYEAEQMSLGRRVALKVLPFAATLDDKQLQRFKNEAQAAAQLHHTNIVPVYAVGCERGVHYYAMQFIDGQTLAQVIAELRQAISDGPGAGRGSKVLDEATVDAASGRLLSERVERETINQAASLSTEGSIRSAGFFRAVAQIGVQAAEALEHSHQLGIVHRDIKPANLLIQGGPGPSATNIRLWVTDFGLAQVQGGTNLTMSGDLLGTLRYMSPEQALAQRVAIDHRTDIYSLGATLYELLTLEPAFPGRDRQELLKQIAFHDPQPSRRLNAAIPIELETIVAKAMEKNPAERYATAQELADDLQRFLNDEPIRARRPTLWQKTMKWARRNRPVVWSAGISLAVLAVLVIIGLLLTNMRIARKQDELDQANKDLAAANVELASNVYIYRIALAERALAANQAARAEELLDLCPPEQCGWEWYFLKWRIHEEPMLVGGHTNFIGSVAFSSNGQILVSAGWDGTVRLWDAATGKPLRTLTGASPDYARVAISGDGRRVAAASWDATVTLWDLAADERRMLTGHTDRVVHVAFSPDGAKLASASHDQTARIWDLRSYHCQVLSGHTDAVRGVAYNQDGTRLATTSSDQSVWIWETGCYRPILRLTGHDVGVSRAAFSPDGTLLASAGMDRTVRLWDAATGALRQVLRGHTSDVNDVVFSPDGRRLASAAEDATVRLWDPQTGQEILTLRSHGGPVQSVAFSPDGRRLASAGNDLDMKIRIWNASPVAAITQPQLLRTIPGHTSDTTSLEFSQDGKLFASGSRDHTVRVYESATGQPVHTFRGSIRDVTSVAFRADSVQLAAVGGNGILQTWDVQTGQSILDLQISRYSLDGVTYSLDGKHLAVADIASGLRLLDTATGKQIAFLNGREEPLFGAVALAFSPDGQTLAAGCDDEHVRLWDPKTRTPRLLRGHQGTVASVAFHPDGKLLASAGFDGWLVVWDWLAGKEVRRLHVHNDVVNCVRYSSDGKRLATGSRDGTVKVWDAATATVQRRVRTRQGEVWAVAFHPDDKWLAAAGSDGTIKIWEVPQGK